MQVCCVGDQVTPTLAMVGPQLHQARTELGSLSYILKKKSVRDWSGSSGLPRVTAVGSGQKLVCAHLPLLRPPNTGIQPGMKEEAMGSSDSCRAELRQT